MPFEEEMPKPQFIKVPSKVMLLGEYGVLAGGQALLAVGEPEFELTVEKSQNWVHPFHIASPTGQLLAMAQKKEPLLFKEVSLSWRDPYEGRGGVGESTASFVAVGELLAGLKILSGDARALWTLYQKFSKGSGVDLLAQAEKAWILAGPIPKVVAFKAPELSKDLMVFSATHLEGRKVRTHEHLAELNSEVFEKAKQATRISVALGAAALIENSAQKLGLAMKDFSEQLSNLGLECSATQKIRTEIQNWPEVWGLKGCGALLADTIVIVLKDQVVTNQADRSQLVERVEKDFDLKHISFVSSAT